MRSLQSTSKRRFLKYTALLAAGMSTVPFIKKLTSVQNPNVHLFGTSPDIAHQIRQANRGAPHSLPDQKLIIVGSGIAGLSAARALYQQGDQQFQILDLESFLGGNAACSNFNGLACGWGSHYLPILSDTSEFLQAFLKDENIITGFDSNNHPIYNELFLCHDLKERLYLNGNWQTGLVPRYGVPSQDLLEIERFFELMDAYKFQKGNDGLYAFSIPIAMSSQDPKFLALERTTMAAFLNKHDFHSPYLKWYVNYCCRDDYGADIEHISAWAGIHYHASRRSHAANADEEAILTWPEGNGFLAQRLAAPFVDKIMPQSLVYAVKETPDGIQVQFINTNDHRLYQIHCEKVILAVPEFVAYQLLKANPQPLISNAFSHNYSPWLVANLLVDKTALEDSGEMAWDNVSFYSDSLGYVNASHQHLNTQSKQTYITYYKPFSHLSPPEARHILQNQSLKIWQSEILRDLSKMHPAIKAHIHEMHIRLYGHGMCIPGKEFIWGHAQKRPRKLSHQIFMAHSDMSGISLFEEAFWQGLETAKIA